MSKNIVELPLEEAIVAAATQNRLLDVSMGEDWVPWDLYLEEARYLLTQTGENWMPEDPDLPLIRLKRDK